MGSKITKTTLRMGNGPDMWDNLILFVKSENVFQIIHLHDRNTALDINRRLSIAAIEKHTGPITVDVDGTDYTWNQREWESVLNVTESWSNEYMILEHAELFS